MDDELWLVVHLMIAGRLHWRKSGAPIAGRNTLAAFDFADGSLVLTEAGMKHRASLYVVRGEAALEALGPGGIEVIDADFAAFRAALSVENRTLKRALTNPRFVSGIGNAYFDEILHRATLTDRADAQTHRRGVGPALRGHASDVARVDRTPPRGGVGRLPRTRDRVPSDFTVHGKFGQPCPRCGAPVQRIRYADNETNYCARCQTGGSIVADRSLSRLLKADWHRTLEKLDALKRRA